ncbi:RICIN domain-containing protein [Lentzea alba]|uniref:RICIN domain-containing protein n=1 Tax=Lentzea alba TaxID=2714351 RepID=UPI0039BFB7E2
MTTALIFSYSPAGLMLRSLVLPELFVNLPYSSSSTQEWALVRSADLRYGLVNRASGLAVRQVHNGTASILEQQPFHGGRSDETVWALVPA